MPTTEKNTSTEIVDQPDAGTGFLAITREQALKVLTQHHGSFVDAIRAPLRNIVDGLTNRSVDPTHGSNVIDARNRFNTAAANDTTFNPQAEEVPPKIEEVKKAA